MTPTLDEIGLPSNAYAERTFLGGILARGHKLGEYFQCLSEQDFTTDSRKAIWAAMVRMHGEGVYVDHSSMAAYAHANGLLDRIGGLSGLMEVTSLEILDLDNYVGMIRNATTRRQLIYAGREIMQLASLADRDPKELVEAAHNRIRGVEDGLATQDEEFKTPLQIIESYGGLDGYVQHSLGAGVPFPFPMLQELTGGMQDGDLIVIGGDTGQGKTALVLNILLHAARLNFGSALFSLEMSMRQILNRFLSQAGGFSSGIFRHELTEHQRRKVAEAVGEVVDLPIYTRDNTGASIQNIEGSLRRLKAKHDIKVAVVDYLQLVNAEGPNRAQQVGAVTRGLKNTGMATGTAMIALSQFSNLHLKEGRKARVDDYKESGDISHAANLAMNLEAVTEQTIDPDPRVPIRVDLAIRKQRDGLSGDDARVPLWFTRATGKFEQV